MLEIQFIGIPNKVVDCRAICSMEVSLGLLNFGLYQHPALHGYSTTHCPSMGYSWISCSHWELLSALCFPQVIRPQSVMCRAVLDDQTHKPRPPPLATVAPQQEISTTCGHVLSRSTMRDFLGSCTRSPCQENRTPFLRGRSTPPPIVRSPRPSRLDPAPLDPVRPCCLWRPPTAAPFYPPGATFLLLQIVAFGTG
jgi:hypothetical protein